MSAESDRFFAAMGDAAAMSRAGDKEGAADLRSHAERDYIAHIRRRIAAEEQMELNL